MRRDILHLNIDLVLRILHSLIAMGYKRDDAWYLIHTNKWRMILKDLANEVRKQ